MNTDTVEDTVEEIVEGSDEDEPDPSKSVITKKLSKKLDSFAKEAAMINKIKRALLKKKLKKEEVQLLRELVEVKRKLKILDELDSKKNK